MTEDGTPDAPSLGFVFAENMRAIRLRKRMLQRQLAALLQVSTATISAMENHKRAIALDDIRPICKALGVSVWDLLAGVDDDLASDLGLERRQRP